ncbi:expressed unknown protein [Seminavis robusta]|uniref:RXYLT1 C-terminal domain-containing protein n=1 Tax=Seminavis robusta TaxID=568900 RepID=A0A9N8HYV5_9STRA|nr:expressed unknown protein [Seminavis robusta]|eukprot:Sro2660_g333940.1 n/a (438) ;mRNA; f:2907-4220
MTWLRACEQQRWLPGPGSRRALHLLISLCGTLVLLQLLNMPSLSQQYWTRSNNDNMKDLESRFHTQRLKVLQNVEECDLLDWRPYHDFHNYLDHFEMYVLNKTADPSPPLHQLTNYSYFHLPYEDEGESESLCWAANLFYKHYQQPNATALPHVLVAYLSRDWGAFSVKWTRGVYLHQDYTKRLALKQKECYDQNGNNILQLYLNHPNTKAVITTQAHDVSYEKGHSIPLGLEKTVHAHLISRVLQGQQPRQPRSVLLYINYREWPFRVHQLQPLHKQLQVPNSYQGLLDVDGIQPVAMRPLSRVRQIRRGVLLFWRHKIRRLPLNSDMQILQEGIQYFHNISHAKFMLSPVGWGLDCYRNYEMLYMGTIPVIETRNRTRDRMFHIFDDLPVAFIDHFDNLTNEWLEAEYRRILQGSYHWEKLTKQYWLSFTKAFVE